MLTQLTCPHCKKEFVKEHQKQIFCSRMCSRAYDTHKKLKVIDKVCVVCNKAYTVTESTLRISKNKDACYSCYRKESSKDRLYLRQCKVCGKDFRRKNDGATVCSAACEEKTKNRVTVKFETAPKRSVKQDPKVKLESSMPCVDCAHGQRAAYSDTGWECKANARVCAPFTEKKLFKQREGATI